MLLSIAENLGYLCSKMAPTEADILTVVAMAVVAGMVVVSESLVALVVKKIQTGAKMAFLYMWR